MALLSEVNKGMSPYQQTQIFSCDTQKLLQSGYQEASKLSPQDQDLIKRLQGTLENIKAFWWDRFRFVGIDDKGKIPPFFVHFQDNNAYYHPPVPNAVPEHFAFNDQYVHSPEVVAHEFTHGVIQWLNPLGNAGEAGAINESISDVVGIVFKRNLTNQYGQTIYTDWKISTFRDLSAPITKADLKDSQPKADNDMGHVHHNSKVLSHAFYLAASKLEKFDQGNRQLLDIWIGAIAGLKDNEKNFNGFINKTIEVGFKKGGGPFRDAIVAAWERVGVKFT